MFPGFSISSEPVSSNAGKVSFSPVHSHPGKMLLVPLGEAGGKVTRIAVWQCADLVLVLGFQVLLV